jgi:poly-gamma-glutamate capsule biosynthesis protein CapA/YwtB (metallophosphatase superfamily)
LPVPVTVLIGADLCPIEGNRPFFERGDAQSLFHDLLPEFTNAGLVIANLECPLIECPSPIAKTGPVFGESPSCLNGIKQAGIDVLCLANNHILDHGPAGLLNTMEVCSRAGVATVGAGENLNAARRILVQDVGGLRIGILAVAEREFSIATTKSAGSNPLDPIDFVRSVNAARSKFDYLIVLLHGSDEFHVPTPRIQKTCRFMIEMGANAVVVQHPHELGGYEAYQGGHIVYGQGALVMDEAIYRRVKSFHVGFLVKLSIASDSASTMDLIPFVQSDPVPGARRMSPNEEQQFRSSLAEKSKSVLDEDHVNAEWLKFCQANKYDYLSAVWAYNRPLMKLNARGLLTRLLYDRRSLLRARNVICCETHHEALETIFTRDLM